MLAKKEKVWETHEDPQEGQKELNGDQPFRKNRIFILDTNVLLHDSRSLFAFAGVVIGIPFVVLEELDSFKREPGELGANARKVVRALDELRSKGSLSDGVMVDIDKTQSLIKVFNPPMAEEVELRLDTNDNLIIATVLWLVKQGNAVTFVTKDVNARVKADALGLKAEDYVRISLDAERFYRGWVKVQLAAGEMKKLIPENVHKIIEGTTLYPNEFVVVESQNNPWNYRLFRSIGDKRMKEVTPQKLIGDFQGRNVQQMMALDLLLDDEIKIVTLVGPAGTGKTFLVLLAGLLKVLHDYKYRRLMITRPIVPLGADVGYLPGELDEKLRFWMQPVYDNLEFIFSEMSMQQKQSMNDRGGQGLEVPRKEKHRFRHDNNGGGQKREKRGGDQGEGFYVQEIERLQQRGILSLEAITYMRGRSIPHQFMFIDEVQNLTPHEVKTIVSRAGDGTKIILAGDPFQIDSPFLDFSSNGLTVTVEKLKEQVLHGTAFLETTERSDVAQLAAELL